MDLADQLRVVVIDEVPAVGLKMWDRNQTVFVLDRISETLLETHIHQLQGVGSTGQESSLCRHVELSQ
jgi:hypothetical protein